MNINILNKSDSNFYDSLKKRLSFNGEDQDKIQTIVKDIINEVVKDGDEAVIRYTNKFDRLKLQDANDLVLPKKELKSAYENLDEKTKQALIQAAERIKTYHEKQLIESWSYKEEDGSEFGQKITPLDKVGLYVPGGKAAYPSSVLMNAIPAKVAGVNELIMVVPTPDGIKNNLVLAAAYISGVSCVYTIGGAQAIAALAYGTKTIPQVDKIVGPGNAYVAEAKRLVFGQVGIDMIAGPSEILIISDGTVNPDWIAMDLFSQAEHDELAQSILISDDKSFFEKVLISIDRLINKMPRAEIIKTSLQNRGIFIQVDNLDAAAEVSNFIAPEHLELSLEKPKELLDKIKHAGAIFIGKNTCEAVGDYCAGPNHVLPTSRTARFSSPLGVYDFQKRSSLIWLTEEGADKLGKTAAVLAEGEGLYAHTSSALFRVKNKNE